MRLEYRPKKQLFVTALLLFAISAVYFIGSTICLPYFGYLTRWNISIISACVMITFVVVFFVCVYTFIRREYSKKESLLTILFLTPVAVVVIYLYVGFFVVRYHDNMFDGQIIEIGEFRGIGKGLANKYGFTIVEPQYGRIRKKDEKAFLYAKFDHEFPFGIYDIINGQMVCSGTLFDNGIIVTNSDGKKGISSLDGTIIVPSIYDDINRLNGRVFLIEMNGYYGLLDCMGYLEISPSYEEIATFEYDGDITFYVIENNKGGRIVYKSNKGRIYKAFDTSGEVEAVLDEFCILVSEEGCLVFVNRSDKIRTNMKHYEIDRTNKTVKLWSDNYSDYVLYKFYGEKVGD